MRSLQNSIVRMPNSQVFASYKIFMTGGLRVFSHTYSRMFMIKRNKNSNFECQNKEIVVTDGI